MRVIFTSILCPGIEKLFIKVTDSNKMQIADPGGGMGVSFSLRIEIKSQKEILILLLPSDKLD